MYYVHGYIPGNEERGPPCTLMRLRLRLRLRLRASAVKKSAPRNYVFLEINNF